MYRQIEDKIENHINELVEDQFRTGRKNKDTKEALLTCILMIEWRLKKISMHL